MCVKKCFLSLQNKVYRFFLFFCFNHCCLKSYRELKRRKVLESFSFYILLPLFTIFFFSFLLSCSTKSKAKYFHVLISYLNNEFNIVTIFQTVSSVPFILKRILFFISLISSSLKFSFVCRIASNRKISNKKATRKISTALSIDLCTLRLIFV